MDSGIVRRLENAVERLERLANQIENKEQPIKTKADETVPASILKFDESIKIVLQLWQSLSLKIGGDVAEISHIVGTTFDEFRLFLLSSAGQSTPDNDHFSKLLEPVSDAMGKISNFKEEHRSSEFANHLAAVDEAKNAFGWVTVQKTPAPFIKDMIDASQFYINRILKEYKEKNNDHVEWAKTWKSLWENMYSYVKSVHTTGLVWNTNPALVPKKTGAPPPPPPPLPANLFENVKNDENKAKMNALFDQINKGSSVTSGLKKVTADMQTHKNPALRKSNTVNINNSSADTKIENVKKPSIYLQDGKQWNIDNVINDKTIEIEVTDRKQTIYIWKCEKSHIKINGKANAITIDGCKNISVLFDGLVSQCEVINSNQVQIQTLGELSCISIQKTDGCQVYLSKVAQNAQIVTSKSSEMNILAQLDDDEEYTEMAVPEQYVTMLKGRKLETSVSEIV